MGFPPKVKEDALVACNRHCCLCHKYCGLKIELHHIQQKSEGGEDTLENCIPLCFDCHGDMRSYDHKHPKGTKYTPSELKRHRDNWYEKVKNSPSPTYSTEHLSLDKRVFLSILELLPYDWIIRVLDRSQLCVPFPSSIFSEFDRFVIEMDDPSMEFIDTDLEGMRVVLRENVQELADFLAKNTWPTGNDKQSVPVEWEDTQPERLHSVTSKIASLSSQVVKDYQTLVREGRKRLGVTPCP
jgi:hypothetical protein